MKYWVYKDSRIHGPFDKEVVWGIPGLNSGTLVCAGDPAGGAWISAGELGGLTGISAGGVGALFDDLPSSIGLLDQLQIDSAGLVDDDEFSGSFAEELFQDASFKKGLGDVLSVRAPSDDAEVRRARDKISELTAQLEVTYRHVSELEVGQVDLTRRLVEKDLELRARGPVKDGAAVPEKTSPPPTPPPIPGGPPSVRAPSDDAEARRARDKISELTAQLEAMYRHVSELEVGQANLARLFAEAEARRARDKVSEVTAQLEAMSRHVSELEVGQADLARRLDAKDHELRSRGPVKDATAVPETMLLSPAPPTPVEAASPTPPAEAASPLAKLPDASALPEMPSFAPAVEQALPSPAIPFEMPSFAPAVEQALPSPAIPFEMPPAPAPVPEVVAVPKVTSFGKPKSFKIVQITKSFKVIGPDEAVPSASPSLVPESKSEEVPPSVEPPDFPSVFPTSTEPSDFPSVFPGPIPVEVELFPPSPVMPVPVPILEPQGTSSFPASEILTPEVPPPNTLSRFQSVPDLTAGDLSESIDTAAPANDVAAARFAKPEPALAPPAGGVKKPGRNRKVFLIAGGVLVTSIMIGGVIFMRRPKDDLKQMATLDDGQAPIGLPADDIAVSSPPLAKPNIAPEPQAPAPPPGPSAEHMAAIEVVKDFPLNGGRGTVGRWLQYSYTASPGAGAEEWNASTTGDNTVLVEYRLVPGAIGGRSALYLFEVYPNGIVMGKTIEARQMLSGGPSLEASKVKKKPSKKGVAQRRAVRETPKAAPLPPQSDPDELRPPAEDDGAFGSDTVNSDI
ncbi:MAG: hypothetical protein AAB268_13560 [Elusimicrobiota bacterium]